MSLLQERLEGDALVRQQEAERTLLAEEDVRVSAQQEAARALALQEAQEQAEKEAQEQARADERMRHLALVPAEPPSGRGRFWGWIFDFLFLFFVLQAEKMLSPFSFACPTVRPCRDGLQTPIQSRFLLLVICFSLSVIKLVYLPHHFFRSCFIFCVDISS